MPTEQELQQLQQLINTQQYQAAYEKLLQLSQIPINNDALVYDIAQCLYALKKDDELITMLEQLQKITPRDARIFMLYALLAMRENNENIKEAIKNLKKVLELDPDNATAYYNLGVIFEKKRKYTIAKKMLEKSVEKAPKQAAAYLTLGYIAKMRKEYEQEKQFYLTAIQHEPEFIDAHINLGMHYLRRGEYLKGWAEYEWRLKKSGLKDIAIKYTKPYWQGQSLANKTLVIFAEQGYGDAILFIRYIALINKQGGNIILECKPALIKLFESVSNIDKIIPLDEALPHYDYYCPLLSLPRLFNTSQANLPCEVPYLDADIEKIKYWNDYFSPYKNQLKVGLVWAGNVKNTNDYYRSVNPHYFSQLSSIKNVMFFSLQKEATLDECKHYNCISLGQHFNDFSDTAACISELDLVISVDTAVAHLAGALNKPTWILIAFFHDWRWLEDCTDSPWYPSVTLYRQTKRNDWQSVFDKIKQDILGLQCKDTSHQ